MAEAEFFPDGGAWSASRYAERQHVLAREGRADNQCPTRGAYRIDGEYPRIHARDCDWEARTTTAVAGAHVGANQMVMYDGSGRVVPAR